MKKFILSSPRSVHSEKKSSSSKKKRSKSKERKIIYKMGNTDEFKGNSAKTKNDQISNLV